MIPDTMLHNNYEPTKEAITTLTDINCERNTKAERHQKNDWGVFGLEAGNFWNPSGSCFVYQHFLFAIKK